LLLRKIHKYAGVFFAPALLFFSVSGLLQTFDFHKAQAGVQPSRLVLELAALHKNQNLKTPRRPEGRAATRPDGDRAVTDGTGRRGEAPQRAPSLGAQLMKLFVAATAVVLGATTLAGLYMALQAPRGRGLVWGLLALGMATPAAMMLLM
jgi:hypothetical protein